MYFLARDGPDISVQKFSLADPLAMRDYFDTYGYCVVEQAIDRAAIDAFLDAYTRIKRSPGFVYYSQSVQSAVRPQISKDGYIRESMQNASRLALYPDFAKRFQHCIYADSVSAALSALTGRAEHVSWQNMFFDQSTGTVEHQDSWYLDTDPSGDLVGVWYALEDIDPACGPFFVCPGSHRLGLLDRADYPDHREFVVAVRKLIAESDLEKKAMCLNKGDILLWHPFLVHGAFACEDSRLSRKSFTAHFYPSDCTAKDTESNKLLSIYDHAKPKQTFNPAIQTAYRFPDAIYNLLVYALFLKSGVNKRTDRILMRRESYE